MVLFVLFCNIFTHFLSLLTSIFSYHSSSNIVSLVISLVIHFDYKQCYIHLPQEYPCSCFLNFKGITEVQWYFLLNLYINHINLVKSLFHYCCLYPFWILNGWWVRTKSTYQGDSQKVNKQTNKRSGKTWTYLFQQIFCKSQKKISGNVRKWLTIIVLKAHNVSIHKLKENTITEM